jgi:periplasmic copper chaperone A
MRSIGKMKKKLLYVRFIKLVTNTLLFGLTCQITPSVAQNKSVFELKSAWTRETITPNSNTAIYGTLKSYKKCDDLRLTTDIAAQSEIHQMIMRNQSMQMKHINPFSIKTNQSFDLLGPYHIMLINLNRVLSVGETITLKVSCAKPMIAAQKLIIPVKSIKFKPSTELSKSPATQTNLHNHDHHDHNNHHMH